uniref:Uncharacterized protein n=1 Tax=Caenorhabditis japonica TaxID=281687 RepID=A0A8R1IQ02_CAEJA
MSQFRNCKFRFIRAAKRLVAKRHSSESYVSCESSQFRKVTLRNVAEPRNQSKTSATALSIFCTLSSPTWPRPTLCEGSAFAALRTENNWIYQQDGTSAHRTKSSARNNKTEHSISAQNKPETALVAQRVYPHV